MNIYGFLKKVLSVVKPGFQNMLGITFKLTADAYTRATPTAISIRMDQFEDPIKDLEYGMEIGW